MDDMGQIKWCLKQKNGIKLIEPNEQLGLDYIKTSEETFEVLKSIKNNSNIWLATTKYYCKYFAFYSILMKLGIKSEIHECTIELANLLENEKLISPGTSKSLKKDKNLRIQNQYYLKNIEIIINQNNIQEFIFGLKKDFKKITTDNIKKVRKKIK